MDATEYIYSVAFDKWVAELWEMSAGLVQEASLPSPPSLTNRTVWRFVALFTKRLVCGPWPIIKEPCRWASAVRKSLARVPAKLRRPTDPGSCVRFATYVEWKRLESAAILDQKSTGMSDEILTIQDGRDLAQGCRQDRLNDGPPPRRYAGLQGRWPVAVPSRRP